MTAIVGGTVVTAAMSIIAVFFGWVCGNSGKEIRRDLKVALGAGMLWAAILGVLG